MDIKAYRQATLAGVKFLLSQQNEDGSFKPVEMGIATYHKVPFALAATGQFERASRLCGYIVDNVMDDEGDFGGHFPRTPLHTAFHLVPNAWLVAGTQRMGQFGISLKAVDFLGGLQHPEGGFYTAGPAATRDAEQDVLTTATCGLALLYCGRTDEAIRAGSYLKRIWESQPAAAARLHLMTRKGHELVTDGDEEAMDQRSITVGKKQQWYHAAALAAGFLARLSEATDDPAALEASQKYVHFVDSCGPDRYDGEKAAFFGWAAAILHSVTNNANFRRIATSVADGMIKNQLQNGSWLKGASGEDETSDVMDATAEGIICMTQIIEGLKAGE